MREKLSHQAVLLKEAIDALVIDRSGFYIDGTFGRGGHTRRLLGALSAKGRVLAIDKDPRAIAAANQLVAETELKADADKCGGVSKERLLVEQGSFAEIGKFVEKLGLRGKVNGVLLDLGVSSPQLDDAERGFSFNHDGPLDMRMNPDRGISAAQWLAATSEKEIADVIYQFGEERYSRRLAKAIVAARKDQAIETTAQLAEIIKQAHPAWVKNKHPATKSFQAIRIFINQELEDLSTLLSEILDILLVGGRLVVISFHSLEDRLVKQFIQIQAKGDYFPRGVPVTQEQLKPRLKKIGKAIKVSEKEIKQNIRARSAIMRVAEKTA